VNDWSTRRYDFSFVIPPIAALTLTNCTAKILTRDGREQTVAIHWQCNGGIGHGSIRPMFVCQCGYGAFRLFNCFAAFRCQQCAIAFGVRYASQQVSRQDTRCCARAYNRAGLAFTFAMSLTELIIPVVLGLLAGMSLVD
jgi:hypothetical protein